MPSPLNLFVVWRVFLCSFHSICPLITSLINKLTDFQCKVFVKTKEINIDELKEGQTVKVILKEKVDISEHNTDVIAAEINVLN